MRGRGCLYYLLWGALIVLYAVIFIALTATYWAAVIQEWGG